MLSRLVAVLSILVLTTLPLSTPRVTEMPVDLDKVEHVQAAPSTQGAPSFAQEQAPAAISHFPRRSQEREADVAFINYLRLRTVQVYSSCTPLSGKGGPEGGRGSGSIVKSTPDASYIFTAAHVVSMDSEEQEALYNCKNAIVLDPLLEKTGYKFSAEIVVRDRARDFAVLKVSYNLKVSSELELDPQLGEELWALGYPVQLLNRGHVALSVTTGTLATLFVDSERESRSGAFHRVTSQVYFGNSGGGVWTKDGKLIAIVCMLYADPHRQAYEGYYYVKPVNDVVIRIHEDDLYWKIFGN